MEEQDAFMPVFIFIFFAIVWYLFRRNSGEYFINHGIAEVFVVAFLIITGQTVVWISRYYMPHVVANGFAGSILGRPIIVTDRKGIKWAVFNTGEYLEPFHGKGKLATLVIPLSQLNQAGRNYVSKTFVKKCPPKQLPSAVYTFLVHSGDYNLYKIYHGRYSEEFIHSNPEVTDYEAEISHLNNQINIRNDLLEGRNDEIVELVKFGREVAGEKRSILGVFGRKKTADEDG